MKIWKRIGIGCGCVTLAVAASVGGLLYLTWLPTRPVTLAGMSGTYSGSYFGGKETYVLSPDGTFTQRFVRGSKVVYTNNGRWTISRDRSRMVTTITFKPHMDPVDMVMRTDDPVRYGDESVEIIETMNGFCIDVDATACVSRQ